MHVVSTQNLFDDKKSIFEALENVRQATAQASNIRQLPQILVQVPHLYEKYHIAKVRPADISEAWKHVVKLIASVKAYVLVKFSRNGTIACSVCCAGEWWPFCKRPSNCQLSAASR